MLIFDPVKCPLSQEWLIVQVSFVFKTATRVCNEPLENLALLFTGRMPIFKGVILFISR